MANCCSSVGVGLAFLSLVGIIYALASKEWKKNSQLSSQNNLYGIYSYEGLWVRCVSPIPGQFQCDQFDESFLALPAELQGQRAMMCLAALFGVFGVISGALGLECIAAMKRGKGKRWTGRSGGILMLLAGILTIAAAAWYAAEVVREFHANVNTAFSYELGAGLYIAWISGGIALIAGILLLCCTCGDSDEDVEEPGYRYTYKPPAAKPSRSNTEYV